MVLITASLVAFLLLPLVTGLIRVSYSQLLVLRAGALIDETLPSASLCLDPDRLAEGSLSMDSQAVDSLIRTRVALIMPEILANRLEILSVQVNWQPITAFEDHWLGDAQPSLNPIVTCTVRISTLAGEPVLLTRSVRLLQTPE